MTQIPKTKETATLQSMLKSMSLAEKIGQMTLVDQATCSASDVRQYGLGGVMSSAGSCPQPNTPENWRSMITEFWQASTKRPDGRDGIPILYGLDAIHGNANVEGSTIFPHNIGIGAGHNESDIENLAKVTSDEVRAIGANWIFGPNLALARHYHWGRTYESLSSSPEEVDWFGRTYIHSVNTDRTDYPILTCAKHFVADGATDYGIEQGDARISFDDLKQHIKPFQGAIDAGVMSVMVAFSSWNGDKCHGHQYLVTDILKGRLNFEGFVVTDMHGLNAVDDDFYSAVARSVNAGIDMFMMPQNWQHFIEVVMRHVELGSISITRINDAVTRILRAKLRTGVLSSVSPDVRSRPYAERFGCAQHRQQASTAASHSCVLLKNAAKTLPLKTDSKLLVVGKSADHAGNQCGGFTIDWQGVESAHGVSGATTILSGLKQHYSDVLYADDKQLVSLPDDHDFDAVLAVIGETPYAEGLGDIRETDRVLIEAGSRMDGHVTIQPPYGRSLALSKSHPEDVALLTRVKRLGIPIITVLLNGRPLVIDDEFALSDAFITAWLPGSEGQALARLISGEYDFTGRLPFAWPTLRHSRSIAAPPGKMNYAYIWPKGHGYSFGTLNAGSSDFSKTHLKTG